VQDAHKPKVSVLFWEISIQGVNTQIPVLSPEGLHLPQSDLSVAVNRSAHLSVIGMMDDFPSVDGEPDGSAFFEQDEAVNLSGLRANSSRTGCTGTSNAARWISLLERFRSRPEAVPQDRLYSF